MTRSTDEDDSSSDEDAELMQRLQSSAITVEAVLSESQKVAKQGQQRLSRQTAEKNNSTVSAATETIDRRPGRESGDRHENDNAHDGSTEILLGPTERKIATALDQRLERLLSEMFSQSAPANPDSASVEGDKKKRKQSKKAASDDKDTKQRNNAEDSVSNDVKTPASNSSALNDSPHVAGGDQQPMDLGSGVRLFRKAPVNQPILLLPPGYGDHLSQQEQQPTTAETVRASLTRKRDAAELLLLEHTLQMPFPAALPSSLQPEEGSGTADDRAVGTTCATDLPSTMQVPISTAEEHEKRVRKAMKRLKKSLEKDSKKPDPGACAVDGDHVQQAAAEYQAKVAASYKWPLIERDENAAGNQEQEGESNTAQEAEQQQKKKKKKKKKKVKYEAVVVEARQWVPFETRTATLLGIAGTC